MPSRPDGVCRHCLGVGWIVGRGLCRSCYADPVVRAGYRTFRPKRRARAGATYGACTVCGRWRRIAGRERCRTCYRLYLAHADVSPADDPERERRIQVYRRRAALRLPLFDEEHSPTEWGCLSGATA
jgi:hypothetical protein